MTTPPRVTIPMPPPRRLIPRAAFAWTATGVALVLGATMVLPAIAGLQRYVITGGSMSGTYDRGSVVFDRVVPTASLRVGDTITFRPPPGSGPTGLVTHRIHSIRVANGVRVYRTKGDFNAAPDPWSLTLPDAHQARVAFSVPFVGYAVAALNDRLVRIVLVGIPALVIAFMTLSGLWRDAGAEARRRRSSAEAPTEVTTA